MRFLRWILFGVLGVMFLTSAVLMLYFVMSFFFPFLELPARTMDRLALVMCLCISPLIIDSMITKIGALLKWLRRR